MSDDRVAARLTDLETKFAFQEQLLNDLNDALAEQTQVIANLERQLKLLARGDGQQHIGADSAPGDEPPPPHY